MNATATNQKRVVVVGATGMVGGYALRYALDHPDVGRVTAIGRRALGISHPKLDEVLHRDFADCSALLAAGFPHVYLFRPAYIYPVQPRTEPSFSYRLLRAVYPAFRVMFPNQVIRADDLARVMVDAAVHGSAEHP